MRLASWIKPKPAQLDLLSGVAPSAPPASTHDPQLPAALPVSHGKPLMLPVTVLREDPSNPRTEFPESELEELAEDVRQHGILQPIVVHAADEHGHHCIHFGAKRWRAAQRAGLQQVPVVVREAPADRYTQVAENQKRHGLTPLDLARFIRARVDAGESNATIARRLVMDPTTVAHHLALLDLPPGLGDVLKSGRCTSPRTLYELSKLRDEEPERVAALIAGESEITRAAIASVRAERAPVADAVRPKRSAAWLLAQANNQCARLEQTLTRIKQVEQELAAADLDALRQRVASLTNRLA
jgi:ParB family chromosome partitioning protein